MTTHMERLAHKLIADGCRVAVINPYNLGVAVSSGCVPPRLLLSRPASRLRGLWQLMRALVRESRGAVVHFHMVEGDRFYRCAPLFLALTRRACKRVLTIHSGGWARAFFKLGPLQRRLAVHSLRAFDDIICVNASQQRILEPLVYGRVHVIPAFLPPCPTLEPLPEPLLAFLDSLDHLFVTSGCGEALYDYETIRYGLELVRGRIPARIGLVVATYSYWDPGYWPSMAARLQSSGVATCITRGLTPPQFLALLSQARMYLRASLTDGDSVAIREAALMGVQVLATDAVPRPPGTALFPAGDACKLAETILEALANQEIGRLPAESYCDTYAALLKVYRD
ncbi:MAG TPA: glycosyltransferase [Chthonomonadaceae bacterium]|nr:glycosyltransferase [Chthonomonadaceae bacterium]